MLSIYELIEKLEFLTSLYEINVYVGRYLNFDALKYLNYGKYIQLKVQLKNY